MFLILILNLVLIATPTGIKPWAAPRCQDKDMFITVTNDNPCQVQYAYLPL